MGGMTAPTDQMRPDAPAQSTGRSNVIATNPVAHHDMDAYINRGNVMESTIALTNQTKTTALAPMANSNVIVTKLVVYQVSDALVST